VTSELTVRFRQKQKADKPKQIAKKRLKGIATPDKPKRQTNITKTNVPTN
jgi:hypothetical protein